MRSQPALNQTASLPNVCPAWRRTLQSAELLTTLPFQSLSELLNVGTLKQEPSGSQYFQENGGETRALQFEAVTNIRKVMVYVLELTPGSMVMRTPTSVRDVTDQVGAINGEAHERDTWRREKLAELQLRRRRIRGGGSNIAFKLRAMRAALTRGPVQVMRGHPFPGIGVSTGRKQHHRFERNVREVWNLNQKGQVMLVGDGSKSVVIHEKTESNAGIDRFVLARGIWGGRALKLIQVDPDGIVSAD